jgi:hypothetical protein
MPSEVWIGTIEISYFHPDNPTTRRNAFTNVTTWASNAEEFAAKCNRMLTTYGWQLIGIERANPVRPDAEHNDAVTDMLERTRSNSNAIIYGTFNSYPVM